MIREIGVKAIFDNFIDLSLILQLIFILLLPILLLLLLLLI